MYAQRTRPTTTALSVLLCSTTMLALLLTTTMVSVVVVAAAEQPAHVDATPSTTAATAAAVTLDAASDAAATPPTPTFSTALGNVEHTAEFRARAMRELLANALPRWSLNLTAFPLAFRPHPRYAGEWGVFATRAIAAGETLLSVPSRAWFHSGRSLHKTAAQFVDIAERQRVFEAGDGALLDSYRARVEVVLAFFWCARTSDAAPCRWRALLDSWPQPTRFDELTYTTDDAARLAELQLLEPAELHTLLTRQRVQQTLYARLARSWATLTAESRASLPFPTREQFIELLWLVESRIWGRRVPGAGDGRAEVVVTPLMDMLNHAPDAGAVSFDNKASPADVASVGVDERAASEAYARVAATRAYAEGDEVFLKYSASPDAALVITYGFVPEQLDNAAFALGINPPANFSALSPWHAVVGRLVSELKSSSTWRFDDLAMPPIDALHFLRAYLLQPRELRAFATDRPTSWRNEHAAHYELLRLLNMLAASRPSAQRLDEIDNDASLPQRIRRFVPVARRRLLVYTKAIESVKRSWMSLLHSPADPMRRGDAAAASSTTTL